jgi:hypothetical protein
MARTTTSPELRPTRSCISCPDQHFAIFISGHLLPFDELDLQIVQERVIHLELPLERAIRDALALAEESHHLIEDGIKIHCRPSPCRGGVLGTVADGAASLAIRVAEIGQKRKADFHCHRRAEQALQGPFPETFWPGVFPGGFPETGAVAPVPPVGSWGTAKGGLSRYSRLMGRRGYGIVGSGQRRGERTQGLLQSNQLSCCHGNLSQLNGVEGLRSLPRQRVGVEIEVNAGGTVRNRFLAWVVRMDPWTFPQRACGQGYLQRLKNM